LQDLIKEGRGAELKPELRKIIATKNTLRHSTTKYIPLEIHRGRLLNRPEDMSAEEEVKIIAHMRAEVLLFLKT